MMRKEVSIVGEVEQTIKAASNDCRLFSSIPSQWKCWEAILFTINAFVRIARVAMR